MAKPTPKSYGSSKLLRPLTPKGLRREVRAQVAVQYNPQQRQLRREQQAADLQSRRIRAYFPAYERSIGKDVKATKQVYKQANRTETQASNQGAAYAEAMREKLRAEGVQSAAERGVGYNPSQDLTDVKGQLARIASSNTLRGVTAAQGASARGALINQKRIGKREEIDALQQQAARSRTYNADQENLARERGQAATAARNTLRNQEQQFFLGLTSAHNSKANALLSARTSAANSRRSAATSRRGQDISRQNSIRTQRHEDQRAQHSGSSSTPTTRSPADVRAAIARLRNYGIAALHPKPGESHQDVARAIANYERLATDRQFALDQLVGSGISPWEAKQAYARWKKSLPNVDLFHKK
jgi:hypothetical protein